MSGPRPIKKRTTRLGQILTDLRVEARKTLSDVESEARVSATLISGYELGTISPRLETLTRVLDVYGYEVEILPK
tara:strand:- start:1043 stop:1267 length:225 start_codon:yes stop_codon:yes gene_type:complete